MFDFIQLSILVHLGLYEQAKFYAADHYNNLKVSSIRSNGDILCFYDQKYDYGSNAIVFMRLR